MQKSNRINLDELISKRLDAEYYEKPYRRTEQLVHRFENVTTLEKARLGKIPIRRGIDMPKIVSQTNAPVLVTIASFEEPGVNFDGLERIDRKQHSAFYGSALEAGDLIVAMGGYPGRAAICPPNTPASNIGRHTARIVIDAEKADKYYIWAFIRSVPGTLQFAREVTGSVQAGINLEDLREVLIPEPHRTVQTYIGDKVRQAERLRERSTSLEAILSSKMQCCFCGKPKPRQTRHSRISPERLLAERLESEFYTSIVLWAEEEIKGSQWDYKSLGDLAHRIKDGPGGWGVSTDDYVDSGVPVIRAVNLIDGECDLIDCVFISPKKHQELINHCAKQDSVLLSVRGTIGRAAVFSSIDYEEASLNAAVVTIDCKDEILPHFLAEFLNTEIGKNQTQRIANGAVQINMNLTETGRNLIVVPPKEFQQVISDLRQKRLLMKVYSRRLTTAAKFLVEALIESDLKESELKAAQEKLQQGDNSGDREILSKLTRKGYNVAGETPLFPNLDALYEALQESEARSQESE